MNEQAVVNEQIIWIVLKRLRAPFFVIIVTFSVSILGLILIPGVDNNGNEYHMSFFDAFYFVSYMASTIGFGEAPFPFNYPQRIWVSFTIYTTVIGWFYGIGTIVSIIQDESLKRAINRSRFRKQVKAIREPFFIILGYNSVTKSIINRVNNREHRVVVLDRSVEKIEELMLENFYPNVPSYVGEATKQQILKIAGIHEKNCVGVISLFENDVTNSEIATICKFINKKIEIIIKATSKQHLSHFKGMGMQHIQNPFDIISKRIFYSITAPHIWLLEMWLYGHILKLRSRDYLPTGKYIIFGKGRMGLAIEEGLKKANIEYLLYDMSAKDYEDHKKTIIFGDDEDIELMMDLDVNGADCIIAATKSDLLNLTILNTAKQLNPDIFTIARENSLEELSIFQAAKINRIYIVEQILADTTYHYISKPLSASFVHRIRERDEAWGKVVVDMINNITGTNPLDYEMKINEEQAYALSLKLKKGIKITLSQLRRSREDRTQMLHIICLLLKRGEEIYLMPESDMELELNDELLMVSDEENREDFEYIINNIYELRYVLGVQEKNLSFLNY